MLTGLDLNSPIVQQLIKNNPVLAQQLGVPLALTSLPSAPLEAGVTMQQVQDAITERLKGFTLPTSESESVRSETELTTLGLQKAMRKLDTQPLSVSPTLSAVAAQNAAQGAITERLKGFTPAAPADALVARLQAVAGQVEGLLKRALPAADYSALQAYVADGSPGFDNLMKGDALFPLAQLLWETIRESQK